MLVARAEALVPGGVPYACARLVLRHKKGQVRAQLVVEVPSPCGIPRRCGSWYYAANTTSDNNFHLRHYYP